MDASTETPHVYHSAAELYLVVTLRNLCRAARMIWWITSRTAIAVPRAVATIAATFWNEFGPMLETREGAGGAIAFFAAMLSLGGHTLPSEYQDSLAIVVCGLATIGYALVHTGRRRHPMPGNGPDPNIVAPAPEVMPTVSPSTAAADQAAATSAGRAASSARMNRPARSKPRRRSSIKAKRKRA